MALTCKVCHHESLTWLCPSHLSGQPKKFENIEENENKNSSTFYYETYAFKSISGSGYDPAGPDPAGLQESFNCSCDKNFLLIGFKLRT